MSNVIEILKERLFDSKVTKLETAVEIISDMIAMKMKERRKSIRLGDHGLDDRLKEDIKRLVKERQSCYGKKGSPFIERAIKEYGPELIVNTGK